jgi:hypothetical protein
MMFLPVSVILPCRNNLSELEEHVASMVNWVEMVEQVIVVDSSTDNSLDFLRSRLSGNHVEFHSVPPGLYQAWNFGVGLAKSEFCYFSTVSDTISSEGLEHLLTLGQVHGLDAVLSAPNMVDISGAPVPIEWPIHGCVAHLKEEYWIPSRSEAVQWLTAFLPFTILGSSASNLYRSDFLKAHPFPTEYGHGGDAAFGAKISPFVRMGITRKICSRFVTHGQGRDIAAREQLEVAKKFLALLESMSMPAEAESTAAMSRALLKNKIDLFEWLTGLEPLAGLVKDQKGYIEILESQNAMLRRERDELFHLPVGLPLPFVKAGHLLSVKKFLKRKLKSKDV